MQNAHSTSTTGNTNMGLPTYGLPPSLKDKSSTSSINPVRGPYLDVMTIQSRRLLSAPRKQLEEEALAVATDEETQELVLDEISDQDKLTVLLSSVKLLLQPIQIPDLSHTGVHFSRPEQKETENVKLFYPNGVKNTNMREFIKQTMEKSASVAAFKKEIALDVAAITSAGVIASSSNTSTIPLSTSASAPSLNVTYATSPTSKTTNKKKTPKSGMAIASSPPKKPSHPLLNPVLDRQAKDILASLRANTSKITELIGPN